MKTSHGPSRLGSALLAALLVFTGASCSDSTTTAPQTPTVIALSLEPSTLNVRVGTTEQLVAVATLSNTATQSTGIEYSSANTAVATVAQGGLVTGVSLGTAVITAKAGTIQKTSTITVVPGLPATIAKLAGDNQTATVQTTVAVAPSVQVKDAAGNAISGATVTFTVQSGGGTITGSTATTNASGTATLGSWLLGAVPGLNTVTASVPSGAATISTVFSASATARVPGPPVSITIASGAGQAGLTGSALPTQLSVIVRESNGQPLANIPVTFTPTAGSGSVTSASTVTNVAGIASAGVWTLGPTVGTQTVNAQVAGLAPATFTAVASAPPPPPQPATKLVLTRAAANGSVGLPFGVQPIIEVRDANGNLVPTATPVITTTISTGGRLTGSSIVTAVNAVATFTDLTPLDQGTYVISYASPGLTGEAQTVTILPAPGGTPTGLVITRAPNGGTTSTQLSTQPVIEVRDASNLRSGGATNVVTVTVASGPGTLSGTTSVTAVDGVATFTNLRLSAAGTYTLLFDSPGLTTVTSAPFTVTNSPAVTLFIATQPTGAASGNLLGTQPVIHLRDALNITDTSANGPVTATISGGTLSGTTTVNAVNGVATFTNLRVTGPGTYTITFTSPGLASAISQSFTITP